MHLVVEREAAVDRHARLRERHHLEAGAQQDHLAVERVEEDAAVHPGEAAREEHAVILPRRLRASRILKQILKVVRRRHTPPFLAPAGSLRHPKHSRARAL